MYDSKGYGASKYGATSVGLSTPGAFSIVFEATVYVTDGFAASVTAEVSSG